MIGGDGSSMVDGDTLLTRAATVVDIATANNPWPIPAVLEPVPDPVRALSSCPPILLRFRCR